MNTKCASCREEIVGVQYVSSIYCADFSTLLCNLCNEHEEYCMEEYGTNNIPDLLELYSREEWKSRDLDLDDLPTIEA